MLDYDRRYLFILFMLTPFSTLGGQLFTSSIYVVACLFVAILVLVAQKPICRLTTLAVVAPLLLCLYVLIQLTPLPPSLLKILSPPTWSAYSETVWVFSPYQWMPLAVYSAAGHNACPVISDCHGRFYSDLHVQHTKSCSIQHIHAAVKCRCSIMGDRCHQPVLYADCFA